LGFFGVRGMVIWVERTKKPEPKKGRRKSGTGSEETMKKTKEPDKTLLLESLPG